MSDDDDTEPNNYLRALERYAEHDLPRYRDAIFSDMGYRPHQSLEGQLTQAWSCPQADDLIADLAGQIAKVEPAFEDAIGEVEDAIARQAREEYVEAGDWRGIAYTRLAVAPGHVR